MRAGTLTRTVSALLLATVPALLTGGCDRASSPVSTVRSADEPVEVRAVDAPTPDETLDEAFGEKLREAATTAFREAGCELGTYELGEPDHVRPGEELNSPSFPPTSGPHYADWAPFGLYDQPVADGHVVHNLEHGGVAVWFGSDVDDEMQDAIIDLLDDGEKWIVAPRPDIEGLFSAAWGRGLTCSPAALAELGPQATADAVEAWFQTVQSTGSEAERDVPAYAGAMKEPAPVRDISTSPPFQ
jgi:hypothetical protein